MKTRTKLLILIVLAAAVFFVNLGSVSLWDPDEPRQAVMAREMMERGDYLRPYLNGEPYLEKPPMYPWMIIAAAKISGNLNEFAARVPAALSAVFLVAVTFLLGRRIADEQAGFLSGLVLITNYQFLSIARESVMDMTFAFFIGLCVYLAFLSIEKDRRGLFVLSFIPCAFAILSKGPAGLVLPAGIIFFLMIIQKKLKRFLLPLALGCLLAAAIASVWFILAGESYIREFIFRQNITRYTSAFDHAESLWYYFPKIFYNFMPWSLILPFALYGAWKRRYALPLVWFAVIFLFFEFSQSKRAIYLLPLYPAMALLVGLYLRDVWGTIVEQGWSRLLLTVFGVLLTCIPVAAAIAVNILPEGDVGAFRGKAVSLYVYLSILFLAGLGFLYALSRKKKELALSCSIFFLIFTGFLYGAHYMPIVNETAKSPRLVTGPLAVHSGSKEIYTLGFRSAGIVFYLGRPVKETFDINEIKENGHDILIIAKERPTVHMREELEKRFVMLDRVRYEKDHYIFYVRKNG